MKEGVRRTHLLHRGRRRGHVRPCPALGGSSASGTLPEGRVSSQLSYCPPFLGHRPLCLGGLPITSIFPDALTLDTLLTLEGRPSQGWPIPRRSDPYPGTHLIQNPGSLEPHLPTSLRGAWGSHSAANYTLALISPGPGNRPQDTANARSPQK